MIETSGGAGDAAHAAAPERQLKVRHAMAVCVGMVIGAGIFKTSPEVAANAPDATLVLWLWAAGGAMSLLGALCFAEMSAAFPDAGGDYFFLRKAFGPHVSFLFAWSRFAVIHTGSMALLGFVFGDYVAQIIDLGPYTSAVFASVAITALCIVNLKGIRFGIGTQVGLMLLVLFGLICVSAGGLDAWLTGLVPEAKARTATAPVRDIGTAMVFVFLAYGGWSDAATLSSEMRDEKRGIVWALLGGLGLVTALYMSANWAYLQVLGVEGLAQSEAPAADLMYRVFGSAGRVVIVIVVSITSISVMNALLIAGARTTYAACRDHEGLSFLGAWDGEKGTPAHALIAMGVVALGLVAFGTITRGGFSTMVDYLSPVYWLFLTLSASSLIILRRKAPDVARPFRVPGYPATPIIFALSSAYILYSSLVYVTTGAFAGLLVLVAGSVLGAVLGLHKNAAADTPKA
jgi:amino acid transporter